MSRAHPVPRRLAAILVLAGLCLPAIAAAQPAPPYTPPFGAGHNVLIDEGNPGGWSSPQSLAAAVKGNEIMAPIRPDHGWTEEAQRLGAVPPLPATSGRPPQPVQRVGRRGPVLMLAIGNDKVLKLFDYGSLGSEARHVHLFEAFLPAIGYYVVRVDEYEESHRYLISAATGTLTEMLEPPVVSPDRGRALSWHDSQMIGRTLEVVRITAARAMPETVAWEPSQDDGLTYDVAWAPDSQAIVVTEINSKTRQRKTLRLTFKDGAWRPS
ncbi:hypothetical protein FHP25_01385 [Vineibacter terrae]|uniref:WD40 repeat domain-containing protein n=1 Tax=Vineibacter terrae TaxID=2586908 RepID=A0A5C8PVN0_9HYPH|nr:hypothetical protein [Vineibacter terrae]TXL82378.1 hypothetical protein FHP25_01385 [Vineibacter terrae]